MEVLRVDEALHATLGRLVIGKSHSIIKGFSTDSRSIKPGEVFIALIGERFDGHHFIPEVLKKGAEGVIVSKDLPLTRFKPELAIKVEDTLKALGMLASYYRRKFQIRVVAITGSNGKTTLKEMTAKVLNQQFAVLASPKSFNNFIGLSLTLLGLEHKHQFLVVEMGTNHPGEIAKLTRIAKPTIGVITNIGDAHLEFLGDRWGVARAKFEIFEGIEDGVAILNQDDPYIISLGKELKLKKVTLGIKKKADLVASDIQSLGLEGIRFSLRVKIERKDETIEVKLPVLGTHNVYNALACGAIIKALDLEMDLLPKGLASFKLPSGRTGLIKIGKIMVIDDTYNANPTSTSEAIQTLMNLPTQGRKICILGDMLELGQAAKLFHMKTGEMVAKMGVDLLFTVGDLVRVSAQEATKAGLPPENVFVSEDNQETLERLLPVLKEGDVILIKGSRRMGMERIIESLKERLMVDS